MVQLNLLQTQQSALTAQEHATATADLRLALRRIEVLQAALNEDLQAHNTDSEEDGEGDEESATNGSVTGWVFSAVRDEIGDALFTG